jgi:hypothetical protein
MASRRAAHDRATAGGRRRSGRTTHPYRSAIGSLHHNLVTRLDAKCRQSWDESPHDEEDHEYDSSATEARLSFYQASSPAPHVPCSYVSRSIEPPDRTPGDVAIATSPNSDHAS